MSLWRALSCRLTLWPVTMSVGSDWSLYRDLYPVRSREREVTLDDGPVKSSTSLKCVCPPIVEIGWPMPGE